MSTDMIASLCADYNRNGIIDEQDLACLYQGRILRYWVNDDEDNGDSDVSLSSGIEFDWEWKLQFLSVNPRRYVWHKQAWFKGRSPIYGTDWAGRSFYKTQSHSGNLLQMYSQTEANQLFDDTLRTAPVFRHDPQWMFSNSITKANRDNLLARGIPELSYPIGYTSVLALNQDLLDTRNFDLNHTDYRRDDLSWPQRDIDFNPPDNSRPNRWLHTDLLNVSYYYTHKMFEKLVTIGELK